ncbi:MAG: hypothetical protein A2066_21600 [Bacteroidetes bacterium GWB2_41_8]|nr:MAG: hypothetical protein A2066_21600 [Bacteroidetes bacterium GWB2_41_8]
MLDVNDLSYLLIMKGIPKHEGKDSNKKKAQAQYGGFALLLRNPFTCFSNGIIQRLSGFADSFAHGYRLMV